MAGWGGKREGAGRRLNPLKSSKLAAELIERNKRMKGDANCPTPLEYVLGVLWDATQPPEVRFEAAKQALPFCHPYKPSHQISAI
jgi:hypothetical protein